MDRTVHLSLYYRRPREGVRGYMGHIARILTDLQAVGLLYDVAGVGILGWSLAFRSRRAIAALSATRWDVNPNVAEDTVKAKVDMRTGTSVLVLGFLMQIVGIDSLVPEIPWEVGGVLVVGISVIVVTYLIGRTKAKRKALDIVEKEMEREMGAWVKARAECNVASTFEALAEMVRRDVDEFNDLPERHRQARVFRVEEQNEGEQELVVESEGDTGQSSRVTIRHRESGVLIQTAVGVDGEIHALHVTPYWTGEECRYQIDGNDVLDLWQVSQKALGGVFFERFAA